MLKPKDAYLELRANYYYLKSLSKEISKLEIVISNLDKKGKLLLLTLLL